MNLMDALFYWLQMKLVCEERPEDEAARETVAFFEQILQEDHRLASYEVLNQDEAKIYVEYRTADGNGRTVWFDREAAEHMLRNPVLSRYEREQDDQKEGST